MCNPNWKTNSTYLALPRTHPLSDTKCNLQLHNKAGHNQHTADIKFASGRVLKILQPDLVQQVRGFPRISLALSHSSSTRAKRLLHLSGLTSSQRWKSTHFMRLDEASMTIRIKYRTNGMVRQQRAVCHIHGKGQCFRICSLRFLTCSWV